MQLRLSTALCVAILCAPMGGVTASAQSTLDRIGGAVQGAGSAIKQGAENTGNVIVKGAEATGEAIERGVDKTGQLLLGKPPAQEGVLVQAPPPDTPRYLFVQQAQSATVSGDRLVLTGLTPSTYYFTDHPDRAAGHLRHTDFAALWQQDTPDSFRNDPPNAALTTPGQVDDEPIVMELLGADYDGRSMTFRFSMIAGKLPQSARDVAVFIDTSDWGNVAAATLLAGE